MNTNERASLIEHYANLVKKDLSLSALRTLEELGMTQEEFEKYFFGGSLFLQVEIKRKDPNTYFNIFNILIDLKERWNLSPDSLLRMGPMTFTPFADLFKLYRQEWGFNRETVSSYMGYDLPLRHVFDRPKSTEEMVEILREFRKNWGYTSEDMRNTDARFFGRKNITGLAIERASPELLDELFKWGYSISDILEQNLETFVKSWPDAKKGLGYLEKKGLTLDLIREYDLLQKFLEIGNKLKKFDYLNELLVKWPIDILDFNDDIETIKVLKKIDLKRNFVDDYNNFCVETSKYSDTHLKKLLNYYDLSVPSYYNRTLMCSLLYQEFIRWNDKLSVPDLQARCPRNCEESECGIEEVPVDPITGEELSLFKNETIKANKSQRCYSTDSLSRYWNQSDRTNPHYKPFYGIDPYTRLPFDQHQIELVEENKNKRKINYFKSSE